MILSDASIRSQIRGKRIRIDPQPEDWQFQPASVDLTLGSAFLSPYSSVSVQHPTSYLMLPGECVLATTAERIAIPNDLVARVEGKSSWGRKFLMVHSTAGFVDPGFEGTITLELTNLSAVTQSLSVGCAIAQISFERVDQPVTRPYGTPALGSHYQHQSSVTPSALPWS